MAVLDPDPQARHAGEAKLQDASSQSGFGLALVNVTLRQEVPYGLRQLAAVVLKKFVKEHWTPESKHFKEPLVSDPEKDAIRNMLPSGLADPMGKIRTAVGMAVAGIAKWDVPGAWPSLLGDLIRAIGERKDANLVHGAVRCLSLFADELGDEQVFQVVPVLFPQLLTLVSQPAEHGPQIQRRALSVVGSMVGMLAVIGGMHQTAVRDVLAPTLEPWFRQFCIILSKPTTAHDTSDWSVKLEVLKVLVQYVMSFGKLVAPHIAPVMQACWAMYNACLPLYQAAVVATDGDLDEGEVDSDGENMDFESLISQLVEFLLTLVGNRRYQGMMQGVMGELVYLTIGYMQMTGSQVEAWSRDPNQYVADEEEETFTVRVSGELLLDELLTAFEVPAADALTQAVNRRLQDAAAAQAGGNADWWKLREASLLAVGTCSEPLLELRSLGANLRLDVGGFLSAVLRQDLGPAQRTCPFLVGRALWVAARLSSAARSEQVLPFLEAAASGVMANNPPPIQIGACRALAQLATKLDAAALQPLLPNIYAGLGALLSSSTEETLHLVLETLTVVVKADVAEAAKWEPQLSTAVLHIWANHVADPLLSIDAIDVLEALALTPAALPSLQARVLPVLSSIISQPDANSTILVEGALDVATMLLKPSNAEQAAIVHATLSQPVMALMMHSDDAGILQSCSEYMRYLLRAGGEALLSWGGATPADTLSAILSAVTRLMQPDMGDSASLFVPNIVTHMLRTMPSQVMAAMPQLLPAVVAKLASAHSAPLIAGLLAIFGQLAHLNASQLIDFLSSLPSPGPQSNALELVLQVWTERHVEIKGVYEINLSTTALALVLVTGHPALSQMQVKGQRLDIDSGIRTRARARQQAEQWQMVPAPVKIVSLLADMLLEGREGGAKHAGGESHASSSEWEEEGDSDNDGSLSIQGRALGAGLEDFLPDELEAEDSYGKDLKEDPLYSLDLAKYVTQQLHTLASRDRAGFESCCSQLQPGQVQVLQQAFQA
ncbi:hypothetical protein WJX72_002643 [[Myrmecia] bisecta]|uniref:Importin N-terminal domain-containing protein n=1 Tax=[Myrmecia] bisecta TaxID=41462 RepID=A0AAW1PDV8_9CHLO